MTRGRDQIIDRGGIGGTVRDDFRHLDDRCWRGVLSDSNVCQRGAQYERYRNKARPFHGKFHDEFHDKLRDELRNCFSQRLQCGFTRSNVEYRDDQHGLVIEARVMRNNFNDEQVSIFCFVSPDSTL